MAKSHRGSGIRDQVSNGRGTCPVCKRSGIKVLYEKEISSKKTNVCKQCDSAIKKGTLKVS